MKQLNQNAINYAAVVITIAAINYVVYSSLIKLLVLTGFSIFLKAQGLRKENARKTQGIRKDDARITQGLRKKYARNALWFRIEYARDTQGLR